MKKLGLLCFVFLAACANSNCRAIRDEKAGPEAPIKKEMDPLSRTAVADRVRVFKPDGSLQCGQGRAISASEMQKDLKDIHVFSAINKNDGMMRIQQCGTPTGNANVYEIDRKDLAAAIKLGFKEWTGE